ncbi:hypothetical protein Rs2_50131 [Raphanus sativus]|nr:hypothetical protein Rs2_50131 [Raphanus sativus]
MVEPTHAAATGIQAFTPPPLHANTGDSPTVHRTHRVSESPHITNREHLDLKVEPFPEKIKRHRAISSAILYHNNPRGRSSHASHSSHLRASPSTDEISQPTSR